MRRTLLISTLIAVCGAIAAHAGFEDREMLLLMDIPVVVTASKSEQPINEAPATIEVITDKDIERYGFRTVADALRSIPGMDIGSIGFSVYFSARGLNGRKLNNSILFLIDGQSFNDLPRGAVDPCNILLSNVKRIEVIRGPGSSLYGTNAFAGVVNIITKSADDAARPQLTLGGGNYANTHIAATAGRKTDNLDIFFSAEALRTDAMSGHGIDNNDDREDKQFFGKVRSKNLTLFWDRNSLNAGIPAYNAANQRGKTSQDLIGLEWNVPLTERTSVKLLSHVLLVNIDMVQQLGGNLAADSMGSAAEAQLHSRLNDHNTIVAGLEMKNDETNAPTLGLERRSIATRALYVQDEWRFTEKFILTAGGRYDMPTGFDSVLSPRVNLAYKFTDRTVAKAAYGEAFRAPTMLELYARFDLIPGLIIFRGNPDLKPEKIVSRELGISHIASLETQYSLNLFSVKTNDATVFNTTVAGFGSTYRYINKSSAEVTGGEATVRHRILSFWEAIVSYSYQYAKDADSTGGELPLAPRYKFIMQHCLTPTDKLTLSMFTWYTGERDEIWENQRRVHMAPVSVTNAYLAYAWSDDLKLSCSVNNIFNNTYKELDTFIVTGVSYLAEATYRF